MSFGGGSGGGGSIHTDSDVVLNNPATNDVLTYDAGLGKWKNAASSGGAAINDSGASTSTACNYLSLIGMPVDNFLAIYVEDGYA